MSLVDNLLAASFDSIQEPEKKHHRRSSAELIIHPDAEGCIYEIQAPLHNTFDFCSSFSEAQKIAKERYHEYKIWKIFVGSQKRVCLEVYEQRQHNNAIRIAIQQKGIV